MVIKLLQQSTFRRYAAIVLSPFFYFLLFSMCNCAVNWCDKLCFLHLSLLRGNVPTSDGNLIWLMLFSLEIHCSVFAICCHSFVSFLLHGATQSAVSLWHIICPSVLWSYRLQYFKNNLMDDHPGWAFFSLQTPNITDLLQREYSKILARIGVGYGKSGFPHKLLF